MRSSETVSKVKMTTVRSSETVSKVKMTSNEVKRLGEPNCVKDHASNLEEVRSLVIDSNLRLCLVEELQPRWCYVRRYSFHSSPDRSTMSLYSCSNVLALWYYRKWQRIASAIAIKFLFEALFQSRR